MMLRQMPLALRFVARNPAFSAVVITTIAVAICINATVFTAVNAVLLRPLPFKDPDRLLHLVSTHAGADAGSMSSMEIGAYQGDVDALEAVASYFRQPEDRFDVDALMRFVSIPVSTNFFDVLGVQPALGRTLLPEDMSESHVVVISHSFWRRRFGGRADIVGQALRFDDAAFRVVGVMPSSFHHVDGLAADVWTPMWPMSSATARRDSAIVRVRPGVSQSEARARVNVIASRLERLHPESNAGWGARLVPMSDVASGDVQNTLLMLLAGCGVVLLIACVNVGNMLVARTLARAHELRLRLTLGARRRDLVREVAAESAVLALLGGLAGAALTFASVQALVRFVPPTLPRLTLASVDAGVWLWTLGITMFVAVFSGVAPALAVSRLGDVQGLGVTSRATADRQARRLRAALVVAEMALATVLVIGGGLMVRSLINLRATDLGFRPANVVSVYLRPGWGRSRSGPNMAVFYQALRERLSRLPGVRSVGAAKGLPLVSDVLGFDAEVSTDETRANGRGPFTARSWTAVPGYFEALGVPLLKGRYFEPADDIEDRRVAIVSAELARRVFGARDPIGRPLSVTTATEAVTVVGVVGDIRTMPGRLPGDTVYLTGSNRVARLTINLAISIEGDSQLMASRIRDEIRAAERNVAILDISTLDDAFEQSLGYPRFLAWLLNLFGAVGLLLAAIGVYGLGSFAVVQRRREIGVRMAIGADRRSIMALVVGGALQVAGIGAALGTALAIATTTYVSSALYGVSSADPATLGATALILLATAGCASVVPAHRASRVDPSELLRYE